jgi:hypothetical protein
MRRTRAQDRQTAILRGMKYLYLTACEPENFDAYGHDYLCCFYCIASTSQDAHLQTVARDMGRERARHWRRVHTAVPKDADAETIACLVFGSDAADRFGIRDQLLKKQIQKIAADFTAQAYFWFDPLIEPPPKDIPEYCECGIYNKRGRRVCSICKKPLEMMSRYAVWLDALIRSYTGERYGVRLGASFADVIKWVPAMRPYPRYGEVDKSDFYWAVYAITHVVYTLNHYSFYKLSPDWLPYEYEFLKRNLEQAIVMEDPEIMGEFLDALKSFGLTDRQPLVRKGINYLLSKQNMDGSWGDADSTDLYLRYHPTWTAIDGLRDYAWRGERLSFPKLHPMLKRWSGEKLVL